MGRGWEIVVGRLVLIPFTGGSATYFHSFSRFHISNSCWRKIRNVTEFEWRTFDCQKTIVKKRLRPRTGFDNVVRRRTPLRAVRIPVSDRVVLVFSLGQKTT
jgi:hypothetical protein